MLQLKLLQAFFCGFSKVFFPQAGREHTGRNCINLFQISYSANTMDKDPGISGVSKDQKNGEIYKNTHCQVNHSPIIA
jgi:hypothetical protein